jgi:hypothetical protein
MSANDWASTSGFIISLPFKCVYLAAYFADSSKISQIVFLWHLLDLPWETIRRHAEPLTFS